MSAERAVTGFKVSRRSLLLLARLAPMALAMTALTGCAAWEERKIKNELEETLEQFKSPSGDKAAAYLQGLGIDYDSLTEAGLDAPEFARHMLAQFDYELGEVSVDGDHAVAHVSVTAANGWEIAEQLVGEYSDNGEDFVPLLLEDGGEQELAQEFFDELYLRVDSDARVVTCELALSLTKVDGTWQMDDASVTELARAMLGRTS